MTHLGTVSREELELVNRIVMHCAPAEHLGDGVLLTTRNNKRTWQVGVSSASLTVTGDEANFDGSYIVLGRFIQAACSQVLETGSCAISIDGDRITSTTDNGNTTMKLGTQLRELREFNEPTEVSAQFPLRQYNAIFGNITNPPVGFNNWERIHTAEYTASINIGNANITVRSNWPDLNTSEVAMSCHATTIGVGEIALTNRAISLMSVCIYPEDVEYIKLSFAANDPTYARFESGPVTVIVEKFDSSLTKIFRMLTQELNDSEIEYAVGADGVIAVDIEDTQIRIQLFHGNPSIARFTKVILNGVTNSYALLTEINAMNVGRVLNRIWWDNGMIVIGSDLLIYNDLESIQPILRGIQRDAIGLDIIFSNLADGVAPVSSNDAKKSRRRSLRRNK